MRSGFIKVLQETANMYQTVKAFSDPNPVSTYFD